MVNSPLSPSIVTLALVTALVMCTTQVSAQWHRVIDFNAFGGDVFSIERGAIPDELWVCGTQKGLLTKLQGEPPAIVAHNVELKKNSEQVGLCRVLKKSLDGKLLYIGGIFEGGLKLYNFETDHEVPTHVYPDSYVNAVLPTSSGAYIGGAFNSPHIKVSNYESATGVFHPVGVGLTGEDVVEVIALELVGPFLYAGLHVTTIESAPLRRFNILTEEGGWHPVPNVKLDNSVFALTSLNNVLYVGGAFHSPSWGLFAYADDKVQQIQSFPSPTEVLAVSHVAGEQPHVFAAGRSFIARQSDKRGWSSISNALPGHILTMFAGVDNWLYAGGRVTGLQRIQLHELQEAPPTAAPYVDLPRTVESQVDLRGRVVAASDCRCYDHIAVMGQIQFLPSSALYSGPGCSISVTGSAQLDGSLVVSLESRESPQTLPLVIGASVVGSFSSIEVELPGVQRPCERVTATPLVRRTLYSLEITVDASACDAATSYTLLKYLLVALVVGAALVYLQYRRRSSRAAVLPGNRALRQSSGLRGSGGGSFKAL